MDKKEAGGCLPATVFRTEPATLPLVVQAAKGNLCPRRASCQGCRSRANHTSATVGETRVLPSSPRERYLVSGMFRVAPPPGCHHARVPGTCQPASAWLPTPQVAHCTGPCVIGAF